VVLDEQKREAMRRSGLRDVEAFTLYQKGLAVYNDAHGEMDTIEGLLLANEYFDQVIDRVPNFSQVYIDHSDLFVHVLSQDASGTRAAGISDEDFTAAYSSTIADYEAAVRLAQNDEVRLMTELDLAFVSGNWRGLSGRIERALAERGCYEGNWTPIIVGVFGYSKPFYERSYDVLACDPRRSISWFNTSRSALAAGNKAEALKVAKEGNEIAPGTWLSAGLIRALVANGQLEEARRILNEDIQGELSKLRGQALVAAIEGDRTMVMLTLEQLEPVADVVDFWVLMVHAWAGNREEVNRIAAIIDAHHFGSVTLAQMGVWCACGSPWDLEVTPNFAAKIDEGSLPWPPKQVLDFPLKDW
jgi:hypothetical protein